MIHLNNESLSTTQKIKCKKYITAFSPSFKTFDTLDETVL